MPKTEHWQWYVEASAPTEAHHHAIEDVFFSGRSDFQQVAVISTPVFGKMLILDGDTQSSQGDEKIYHESLVHPAMAGAANRNEVLILGGGEGATLREVLRHPGVKRCTMVDIDGLVVDLSKKYLPEWADGAFDEPRANVIIGDALAYMRNHDEKYGVIVSDLTEPLEDSPSNILFNEDVFRPDQVALGRRRNLRAASQHGGVLQLLAALQDGAHATTPLQARHVVLYLRARLRYRLGLPRLQRYRRSCGAGSRQRSMRTARSFVVRISSTMGRRTGALFSLPLYLRRALAADGPVF